MTTSSNLLAAIRELRAENLEALGRSDEAARVRATQEVASKLDPSTLVEATRIVEGWVADAARDDLADPENRTTSDLFGKSEPDSPLRDSSEVAEALDFLYSRLERDRITTVFPKSFRDAKIVVEAYRLGSPVVVNLHEVPSSDKQRVVDFVTGMAVGSGGRIERVSDRTYVVTSSKTLNQSTAIATVVPARSSRDVEGKS